MRTLITDIPERRTRHRRGADRIVLGLVVVTATIAFCAGFFIGQTVENKINAAAKQIVTNQINN